MEPEQTRIIRELRAILQRSEQVRNRLGLPVAIVDGIKQYARWYQRIEFPDARIATTDFPDAVFYDTADDNALGVFAGDEASVLRPWPKWLAIKQFFQICPARPSSRWGATPGSSRSSSA